MNENIKPGPLLLPTGRTVWWTGRVAIGLRYQDYAPLNDYDPVERVTGGLRRTIPVAHLMGQRGCSVCGYGPCRAPLACQVPEPPTLLERLVLAFSSPVQWSQQ